MRLGRRLGEHPHDCLKYALTKAEGHAVEFGADKGVTMALIAETMPVVSFGSSQGLPEDWRPGFPKGRFNRRPPEIPNATYIEGWFEDTLPTFNFAALGYIGLWHCDADLYSSTTTALRYMEPHLKLGAYIVMDEFHGYDGAQDHEQKAWAEFKDRTGIKTRVIGHGPEQLVLRVE